MGLPTFQGLEIAKSGMMAYNTAMQTAAHNLANVGTKGYSRQVVRTTAHTTPIRTNKVIGSGVDILGIERQRSEYYDTKYEQVNTTYSRYETHSYYLNEIQRKLYSVDDKTGGITNSFDLFCAQLTSLPNDAGEQARRKQITSNASTFTRFVQETATYLKNLQDEANSEIKASVGQVNAIADKIVSVTKQINTLEAYGGNANDLRDQRTVLLDELSEYFNIKVLEEEPADGVGLNRFYVYVDGAVFIDTYDVNKLVIKESDTINNINDIDGLYEVTWQNGSSFRPYSSTLGGKLAGLFEARDGNNGAVLSGNASGQLENNADGELVLTMEKANINDVNLLNIPSTNGKITINNVSYSYKSFEVEVSDTGEFTYKFTLNNEVSAKQAQSLNNAVKAGKPVTVGERVEYKGVPYYMAQLNEFVRTFAQEFNAIHKSGYDVYGNSGMDFFNAKDVTSGENFKFTERNEKGYDASFSSEAQRQPDGTFVGSYYYMTALNICVTDDLLENENLFACNSESLPGKSENLNILKLAGLKDDSSMFLHGAPDQFLQSFTADISVDCQKAFSLRDGQKDILDVVDLQRQSICGADEDEETENVLIFQRMVFNQYKVLSVMNEVLDKLINGTAV